LIGIKGISQLFGFSRQSYYKKKSSRLQRNTELIKVREIVVRIRCSMPRIGTRKLYFLIKEELGALNINLGRDVLFKFLKAEHLLIKPKRSYIKTTDSTHWMRKYPNIAKNIVITAPEQLWVSDITYIKTDKGYEYLSLVTDAYSKKIMGYQLLDNLTTQGPLTALEIALKNRKYTHQLTHHSDRGLQYCSADYIKKLNENKVQISMTENGDPYENAVAERINGILKYEFLIVDGFKNHQEAMTVIKESIEIYNEKRPHMSCQMLTPNHAHKQKEVTLKKWKKKTSKGIASEVNIDVIETIF
jgi:putative transposase